MIFDPKKKWRIFIYLNILLKSVKSTETIGGTYICNTFGVKKDLKRKLFSSGIVLMDNPISSDSHSGPKNIQRL